MFSVVLEFVQFYLPYRAFNPVDIAANAFGIAFFSFVWAVFKRYRKETIGPHPSEIRFAVTTSIARGKDYAPEK